MPVRRLTPADADAFHLLRLRALREHPTAFTSSWQEDRDLPASATQRRLSGDAGTAFWGAFEDDATTMPCGMVGLERLPRAKERHKGRIVAMYVAHEATGRGWGRALLRAAIDQARQDGLADLVLTVTAGNAAAEHLYRQAGFESFGVEPRAIRVDGRDFDKVHMHLQLA